MYPLHARPSGLRAPVRATARGDLAVALAAVAIAAVLVSCWAGLGALFVGKAVLAAVVCAQVLRALMGPLARVPQFNAADRVTLSRAALASLALAFIGETPTAGVAGLALAITTAAAVLDAVDGQLARRRGNTTAFGARFDMETDALLVLALSLLAWTWDKAGAWILLAGLARYLFLAGAAVAPWLRRELRPSRRRQSICVIQVVTLIVCIAPGIMPPASHGVAALGLAALVLSFSIDVYSLHRAAGAGAVTGRLR